MEDLKVEKHYGEILKSSAKKMGITTSEIAKRLNMTEPGIYNIYRTKNPRIDVMLKFYDAIGMDAWGLSADLGNRLKESSDSQRTYFTDKMDDKSEIIFQKIIENREYYYSNLMRLEEKMGAFEKALALTEQLVEAKDQVIESLREQLKSAS